MNEQLLRELNDNITRLLAVLDPKPDDDAIYKFCVAEAFKGNWKPITEYKRTGRKDHGRHVKG